MNERTLRPGNMAAAAVVIGGVLIIALPQYGLTIARLVVVTIAAAAGLYTLVVNVPPTWWTSPFDRSFRPTKRRVGADELHGIRFALSGRRQRIAAGLALPPAALRLLQRLIRAALERAGHDPSDSADLESARRLLSPLTWAVLRSEPLSRPTWVQTDSPDERETVDVVHRVLDDLERFAGGIDALPHIDTRDPPAT